MSASLRTLGFSTNARWACLAAVLFAANLSSAGEAPSREKYVSPFLPRGPEENVTTEEHQQKVRAQFQEAQKKALEKREKEDEQKKKDEEKAAKKKEDENESGVRSPFLAIPTNDRVKVVKMDLDPKAREKIKKGEYVKEPLALEEAPEGAKIFEFPNPGKGSLKKSGDNLYQIAAPGKDGMRILPTNEPIVPPEKRRGFWEKLFGSDKPGSVPTLEVGGAAASGVALSKPSSQASETSSKDSLLRRVQGEMMRLQAEEEARAQEKAREKTGDNKAKVIELEETAPPKETAAGAVATLPEDDTSTPALNGVASVPQRLPPRTEAEFEAAYEERYRRGLTAKDMVEREWAFRYASARQRTEAVPHLVRELKTNGLLIALAAGVLGNLPPAHPETAAALEAALDSTEPNTRVAAARSLGQLRVEAAARGMLKRLETERNFPVRAAYCEALGWLGDRRAVDPLKALLQSKDEVEVVQANAAVSLARLGESAGREYLIRCMSHPLPQIQVLGMYGIVALGGPDTVGFIVTALDSPFEEVWTTALFMLPQAGPARALPLLHGRLGSGDERQRRRAAIGMGLLGSDEGVPFLGRALREGGVFERQMAANVIGSLRRREYASQLVEALRDASSQVRQAAAVALTRLEYKEAVPAILDAARGAKTPDALPPALRGAQPDINELLTMLAAARLLKGEEDTLVLESLPDDKTTRWPQYDKEVFKYQLEIVKSYKVIEVLTADGKPVAAVLQNPNGEEQLVRNGEHVAAGFVLAELHRSAKDKSAGDADWINLRRGDIRVTLISGKPPEVQIGQHARKDMQLRPEDLGK